MLNYTPDDQMSLEEIAGAEEGGKLSENRFD